MLEDKENLIKDTCFIVCTFTALFYVLDLVFRFGYLSFQFVGTGNTYNLMTFNYNKASIVVMIISLLLFFCLRPSAAKDLSEYVWKLYPNTSILCIGVAYLVWRCTNVLESHSMAECKDCLVNDLSYGKGMAFSYFYGYLKLILPSTGLENSMGLTDRINTFEDNNNVTVAVKKLFILIPSSSFIPPDLKEVSDGWMESATPLEEETRSRAGVTRRSYKNSVYKIYPGGKRNVTPTYVVAEGATPILTLFEVLEHSHKETELYRKYRIDIVKQFTMKLQELLEGSADCRNRTEIIYYDDYDANGDKVNVAQIILNRIARNQSNG